MQSIGTNEWTAISRARSVLTRQKECDRRSVFQQHEDDRGCGEEEEEKEERKKGGRVGWRRADVKPKSAASKVTKVSNNNMEGTGNVR